MATLPGDPFEDDEAADAFFNRRPSHAYPLGRPRRGEEAANPALSPDQVPGYHSGTTSESITHETTPLSGPYPGTLAPSKSELYRAQTQAKRRRAI